MAGGYKSIDVSNFSKQPLSKRFPPPRTPRPTRPNDFFQPPVQAWNPPDIAIWRSNLVALSQRENLYFAAYKDKIHVTIPRGLKQLLPGKPSLIVNLPRTLDGRRIGGTIDRAHPHFVNNILVGDLGSQEILLVACDDGDILAFYTHHMISGIIRGARGDIIKPFLHENVGLSAWGLAIHKRSRLIAAGCNLRQFTVFSPAYSSDEQVDEIQMLPSRIFPEVRQLHGPQSGRQQNAKKTFRLGPEGHNIPSLSFGDDINGQAQSVLVIDIIGNLWIFDIYSNECMRIPSIYGTPLPIERDMGWGLLVLPLKAFKPVEKPQDALGGTQSLKNTLTVQMVDGSPIKCFAITTPTRGLAEQESPYTQYRTSAGMLESPLELEDDSEADKSDDSWTELEEKMVGRLHDYFSGRRSRPITESPEPRLEFDWAEYAGPTRPENSPRGNREAPCGNGDINALRWEYCMRDIANMVNMLPDEFRKMTSRERLHARLDKLYHEGKDLHKRRNGKRNPEARPYLGNGCAILRTYQTDIELFAPTAAVPRTFCEQAIVQRAHFGAGIDNHVGYVRMNMTIAIPQLSLAIVGQQYGYVALLTLTRLNDRYSLDGPIVSFRVDKILPTAEQESGGLWPRRPLMGIAASPIQMDGITRETARRWRLILHFYDHSIMSYELSRDEHSSDLAVL